MENVMSITLTLEVTIEGFKEEVSDKGNFTARGVSFVLKSAKGCEADQMYLMTPGFGNNGSILFLTKDKGLVAKVNKARDARGSKPKAEAKPMTTDDALAMIMADPAALAKFAAAMAAATQQ
jgi:hypothetical protein